MAVYVSDRVNVNLDLVLQVVKEDLIMFLIVAKTSSFLLSAQSSCFDLFDTTDRAQIDGKNLEIFLPLTWATRGSWLLCRFANSFLILKRCAYIFRILSFRAKMLSRQKASQLGSFRRKIQDKRHTFCFRALYYLMTYLTCFNQLYLRFFSLHISQKLRNIVSPID